MLLLLNKPAFLNNHLLIEFSHIFLLIIPLVVLVTELCPILCELMGCNPPGSSIHGVFQARILEWVAISFSRGPSQPTD